MLANATATGAGSSVSVTKDQEIAWYAALSGTGTVSAAWEWQFLDGGGAWRTHIKGSLSGTTSASDRGVFAAPGNTMRVLVTAISGTGATLSVRGAGAAGWSVDASGNLTGLAAPDGVVRRSNGDVILVPSGDTTGATDYAAIVAAAARAASAGVCVVLGPGDFYVAGTIDISAGTAIRSYASTLGSLGTATVPPSIIGAGRGKTRIRQVTAGVATFRVYSTTGQVWFSRFAGFSLIGPGISNANSCGIQFGGVSAVASNIQSDTHLYDLYITNFATAVRCDDCTQFVVDWCQFDGFVYGFELAYNCDIFQWRNCSFGDQVLPANVSCTTTNGSAVVTGISSTAAMSVGAFVIGANIPALTTIASIDSATQITLSANATASGATTIDIALGTAVATGGKNGATDVGPPWIPAFNTSRGAQNNLTFTNCWFMRLRESLWAAAASTSQMLFKQCYFERGYQVARLGAAGSASVPRNFVMEGCHFSQPQTYRNVGAIQVQAGAGHDPSIRIVNCRTDSSGDSNLPKVPWLYTEGDYGAGRIVWEDNVLPVASTVSAGPISGSGFKGDTLANGDRVRIGGRMNGGYMLTVTSGSSLSWDANGVDGAIITLTAAFTVNNPGSIDAATGRLVTFVFIQNGTGGYSVTFGSKFRDTAGTAIGTVASGTANQRGAITFRYDGVNYRALNALTWAT